MTESKSRRLSLDVFRGMTIAGMILVNTPGSWSYVYPPMRHADWHGFTPTDLVFPFFLFAVGTAMSYSLLKYSNSQAALLKILKRTILIFLIGVLMNTFPYYTMDISTFRIMGVLQRIALAYGIGALLCYFLDQKKLITVSIVILFVYWAILLLFGGDDPFSLEGNVVLKLDTWILGAQHLWRGRGIPFDPEGILSTMPAVVTVVMGYLTGKTIQSDKGNSTSVTKLLLWGNGFIFMALIWDMVFPINKALWTSSYVLMSGGIAMIVLAFFIYIIDVKEKKWWIHPFIVFGTNPLIIYVLSIVWVKIYFQIPTDFGSAYGWVYHTLFVPVAGEMNGSLLFAIAHVAVLWFIGWLLYRRKIIIKI